LRFSIRALSWAVGPGWFGTGRWPSCNHWDFSPPRADLMASTPQPIAERPAIVSARAAYGWSGLRRDAIAGLTVSAIAAPQAMAYALIAGVEPRYGLYAAIVVT